jgi:hypothetical protein
MENGVSVWTVNGRLVRGAFDIDFTAGGHDDVYEFVPAGEVWIDDAIEEKERGLCCCKSCTNGIAWQTGCLKAKHTPFTRMSVSEIGLTISIVETPRSFSSGLA